SYRDALSGRARLPWARLHTTKDYRDMVEILGRFPRIHATFNLTPVLLEQIEAIAAGATDDFLDVARKPPERLTAEDRRFLARHFFSGARERMLEPCPRCLELWERFAAPRPGRPSPDSLRPADARDLQVWFYLAWVDPSYRNEEPIRGLMA